ncbi:MAG TPA: hypothetical protein VGC74_08125 [Stenotrophomonas sp.]|jgi:hypothetical protein
MTTRLHIDRIVLHGVELGPGQRQRFQAELERQLTVLLTQQTPVGPPASQARLTAKPVTLGRDSQPEAGARAVAASLHGCLRP